MRIFIKIITLIVLVAGLLAGTIYLGFLKPPAFLEKSSLTKRLVKKETPVNTSPTKEAILQKTIEDLELDLAREQNTIARLEDSRQELQQELKQLKEETRLKQETLEHIQGTKLGYEKMAKYYSNMKKAKAAAILVELDDEAIIGILQYMDPDAASAILGEIEPQRAADLTKKMLH